MNVLVTGGAGYIGSHTVLELLDAGYDVLIADNFVNSKPAAVERMRSLAAKPFDFVLCDLTDAAAVQALFPGFSFDAVVHFAGLKAVGESVQQGVHGKDTTPFLLARVAELTGGDSLESNIQLVLNNAALASKTAAELCRK